MTFHLRKLIGTLRIIYLLGMARTFGKYEHTIWSGQFSYAKYHWRGETWAIPTGSIEDDNRRRIPVSEWGCSA